MEVHDFSTSSPDEIKQTLIDNMGARVCGRMTVDQHESLNNDFMQWQSSQRVHIRRAMMFSLLVVFGLTLFSCQTEEATRAVKNIHQVIYGDDENQHDDFIMGKVAPIDDTVQTYVEPIIMGEIEIQEEEMMMGQVAVMEEHVVEEEPRIVEQEVIHMMGDIAYPIEYLEQIEIPEEQPRYDENGRIIPEEYSTLVYPNPLVDYGTVELALPNKGRFAVTLFDMQGVALMTVHSGKLKEGTHTFKLDGVDLPAGTYMISIQSKDYTDLVRFIKV
jgi:hypothetical protein